MAINDHKTAREAFREQYRDFLQNINRLNLGVANLKITSQGKGERDWSLACSLAQVNVLMREINSFLGTSESNT